MHVIHALGGVGRLVHNPEEHALAGIGNSALHIAAAQARLGNTVEMYGFSDPLPTGKSEWNGVNIRTIRPMKWSKIGGKDLSWLLPLTFLIGTRMPIDILHIHELGLLHLPWARRKLMHLQLPPDATLGRSRLWRLADGVICCSEYVRNTFLETTDYPREKTFVVHNGATPQPSKEEIEQTRREYNINDETVNIVFAGALVPAKGADVLIDALCALFTKNPEYATKVRMLIIGGSNLWRAKGDTADAYEKSLRDRAGKYRIEFLGLLPQHKVRLLQEACDIAVVPSMFQDPHPLAMCEAMAAGKPIIASRAGGILETVIHEETGILFPMGDREALAVAIKRLVDDSKLREEMSLAARRRSTEFSWSVAADKLDRIYSTILTR